MHLPGVYTALGYRSADLERKSSRPAGGGSGDYHARYDRELLGKIAARFDRDNGIYEGILGRFCDSITGPEGFTLDPATGNKRLDARIRSDWARFGEKPEVRRSFDWLECQRLTLRSIANDGDIAALITDRRQFEFVEAPRIATPTGQAKKKAASDRGNTIDQGVELDALGGPVAYYVGKWTPDGARISQALRRIPEESVVFAANRKRFSQTRGIPILTSTFAMIHRINDVNDSEAIAWQNLAKFAIGITRENGAEQAYSESSAAPELDSRTSSDPELVAKRVVEIAEGIIFHGKPGERIEPIARSLPGQQFPESVRMFLRLIGLPIGLPLEVILLDYSKTNYTASRAALEQAFRMFVAWQRWLKRKIYSPLYVAWLEWQIAAGVYPNRPSTFIHSWLAPEFPWVDHLKEAQAWGQRLDRGLATQSMALRSINMDHDDWLDTREKEVEAAIERAQRLEKQHGVTVPWQVFAGLPTSKSDSAVAAKEGRDPAEDDEERPKKDENE